MLKQSKELEAASFSLIASLPPGTDLQGGVAEGLFVTQAV
jgi:hypothetical protein